MEQLKISYKIYMEAEDIGQSRIHTSIAFVKNQFARSRSVYLQSRHLTMKVTWTRLRCGFMWKMRFAKRIVRR